MINFDSDQENSKMRSTDRVLVLREIPGQKVRATSGLVDPRLFKGENTLHVFMDSATCLWYFKYDFGVLPQQLKQGFTSFSRALEHARSYFKLRHIEITEVKD